MRDQKRAVSQVVIIGICLLCAFLSAANGVLADEASPLWGTTACPSCREAAQIPSISEIPASLRKLEMFSLHGGYVAAGVGLRNRGYGTIRITGIPPGSTVERAYLFWTILNPTEIPSLGKGRFNGRLIVGTRLGSDIDPCWSAEKSWSYRADVTRWVTGNGTYRLSNFASTLIKGEDPWVKPGSPPMAEGATLVIIYRNPSLPLRHIVIYEGNDEFEPWDSISVMLTGFVAGPSVDEAKLTIIGADGQDAPDNDTVFNGNVIGLDAWDGSDPQDGPNFSYGNLWDTDTYNVTPYVHPGDTEAIVEFPARSDPYGDCLVLVAVVFSISGEQLMPWTFMIYLDGDNNLEGAYIDDFLQMEKSSSNPNVNIVVQFDRISGEDGRYGDWTDCRRFHIRPGVTPDLGNEEEALGECNMADPNVLVDFISWAKSHYPAQHYLLAVVNHGEGWQPMAKEIVPTGIVWDDTTTDYPNFMTTAGLGSALAAITSGGAEKLDVLFLDACLMQMVEVAYEVKDFARYLVASQYIGWAPGSYDDYLSGITASTQAEQLARDIVRKYHNDKTSLAHTMSALNLSELEDLAQKVSDFAQALTSELPTYVSQIEDSRAGSQKLWQEDYIDLYHFAQLIRSKIRSRSIQNAAQAVMNAVKASIIAEAHGNGIVRSDSYSPYSLNNVRGISIYFPPYFYYPCPYPCYYLYPYLKYNDNNLQFVKDKQWDEFLEAFLTEPRLTVVKQVEGLAPRSSWRFRGTAPIGSFTLPAQGGQKTFILVPGSYLIAEQTQRSYIAQVSCSSGETGTSFVTVNLDPGAIVICTFTNTYNPQAGGGEPLPEVDIFRLDAITILPNPVHAPSAVFQAEGLGIAQVFIEIYDLSGTPAFTSGWQSGSTFEWHLQNNQGQSIANGVYLYVITVRGWDGTILRSEVKKLVVLR
jgi:hypothetical protein